MTGATSGTKVETDLLRGSKVHGSMHLGTSYGGRHLSVGGSSSCEGVWHTREEKKNDSIFKAYWFLLEKELLKALMKGNSSLEVVAEASFNFLKEVIKPDLPLEGLKGEEEDLCKIHTFLMNKIESQLRDQEVKILDFVKNHKAWVHPNILRDLHARDNEDINVALNQIHYGSLKTSRVVNMKKLMLKQGLSAQVQDYGLQDEELVNAELEFIRAYSKFIDPGVLELALNRDDKAILEALRQIHL
ncbi:hypothetical protein AgCh_027651 [Apium graveolens]